VKRSCTVVAAPGTAQAFLQLLENEELVEVERTDDDLGFDDHASYRIEGGEDTVSLPSFEGSPWQDLGAPDVRSALLVAVETYSDDTPESIEGASNAFASDMATYLGVESEVDGKPAPGGFGGLLDTCRNTGLPIFWPNGTLVKERIAAVPDHVIEAIAMRNPLMLQLVRGDAGGAAVWALRALDPTLCQGREHDGMETMKLFRTIIEAGCAPYRLVPRAW
jgi:hypothetical protein